MREALARIERNMTVRACSRVYETAHVGNIVQPPFLNAAIEVASPLPPARVLDALLGIEAQLGRDRGADAARWGPRTIDLDILWIEGCVVDEPHLTVPHPRLTERAFALVPMLEIAPDAVDPRTHQPFVAPHDEGVRLTDLTLGSAA